MANATHTNTGAYVATYSPDVASDSGLEYFIDFMYGERRGWLELSTIKGDPASKTYTFHQDFFFYNLAQKPALIARIKERAAKHGNVYMSWVLYSRAKRDRAYILPGDIIALDDAAPSDYTLTVQTGPASMHAYRKLNTDVDVATREDLARRETYDTGADKGGWDSVGLIRAPGSFNTKQKHIDANGGELYPVTLHHGNGRTFTVDELRERYPAAPAHVSTDTGGGGWSIAERWIANSEQLLNNNIPRRMVNPNTQGRKVLEGNYVPMSAARLPDTSLMRFIVIKSLVMHGYPDDEIRAIAWLLLGYGAEDRKGSHWLRWNIDGSIAGAREQCATEGRRIPINPTTGIFVRPSTPAPTVQGSRARKDRPQRITEAAYLAWCHEHMDTRNEVAYTRKEVMAALGIHMSTVVRLERKLEGAIERYTSADRRRSWLAVHAKPMMILPSVDTVEVVEEESVSVLSSSYAHIGTCAHREEPTRPIAPAPTPSVCAEASETTAEPYEDNELEQVPAFPEVKRQRRRRPKLEDLPIAARIDELHGRLRGIRKAKSRAKWIGHDGQVAALGRRAGELRKQIAELEQQRPQLPPAEAIQLTIGDGATPTAVDVPAVPHGGSLSGACVPPSSTVVVPPAPRPTMHDALQTYYRCFGAGSFDMAAAAVAPYAQLADLYEKAQSAAVTP